MVLCGRSAAPPVRGQRAVPRGRRAWPSCRKPARECSWKKLAQKLRPDNLFRKAWRWLRDRRRYTGNGEAKFFFGDAPAGAGPPGAGRAKCRTSTTRTCVAAGATRLQPDLIAVFGTSLMRGELLKQGRLGIVNLHGGLSPEYRGADCTFWALYNGEPEKVGCTLHWIDAGIDTGSLIAHVSPEVLRRRRRADAVLARGAGQRRGLRRVPRAAGPRGAPGRQTQHVEGPALPGQAPAAVARAGAGAEARQRFPAPACAAAPDYVVWR